MLVFSQIFKASYNVVGLGFQMDPGPSWRAGPAYQILMGKEAWPQDTLLEGIDLSSCLQKKIWKHVAYGGESVSPVVHFGGVPFITLACKEIVFVVRN